MLSGSRSAALLSGSRSAAMLHGSRSATMHSGSRIAPCLRSMFGSPPCCASRCALLADPALPEPGPRMARFTEVSHQRLVGCSSTTARTRTIACTLTTCARNSTAGSSRASQETRRLLSTPPLQLPLRWMRSFSGKGQRHGVLPAQAACPLPWPPQPPKQTRRRACGGRRMAWLRRGSSEIASRAWLAATSRPC